jgi:ABC-2 type transport system permease protein
VAFWIIAIYGNGCIGLLYILQKYWSLFRAFFNASLTADLEFRANIVIRVITDIIWYAAQIATFEVLYRQTNQIGTWSLQETRVFLGMLFLVDGIYMTIFSENLDKLSEKVRRGDLDLLLAKPVNSQFIMSCQRLAPAYILNLFLSLGYLGWAYWSLEGERPWWNFPWLFLLVPCGVLIAYCGRFFFSAMALIFTRAEYIHYLWYQIYRLGMRPDSIYVPWLKYLLLTALPVAIIASVPARAILRPENPLLFIWCIFITSVFVFLTTRFWRVALRNYSSASS